MASDKSLGKRVDALLSGCAAGDARALEKLYELLSASLFGVALRILKDRQASEDVLHNTFIQIWRQSDRFDAGIISSRAWIISIVRYLAIDRARKLGRELDSAMLGDAADIASGNGALSDVIGREEITRLHRCLNGLPEKSRRMVLLAFLDGLSPEQVSAVVGAPVGGVKSSIRQGLMGLNECMKPHGE